MSFETARLARLPIWLDGPNARAYQGAVAADQDDAISALKAAEKLRWPLPGCIDATDDDGLRAIGEQKRILRAPEEAGALYRDRLGRASLAWYWSGTKAGLLLPWEPFFPLTFTPPTEEVIRLDPTRDATMIQIQTARGRVDPLYFNKETPPTCTDVQVVNNGEVGGFWDGNSEWFSRVFFLVTSIYTDPPVWNLDETWGDPGDWGDGGLWAIDMTEMELAYLRASVRRHKSPGAYPVLAALSMPGGDMWGDPGDWGDGNWNGTENVIYLTFGHVWGEEAWLGDGLVDVWGDNGVWEAFEGNPSQR
jgi:hypothetical protein